MTTETLAGDLPGDAPLRYACTCGYRSEYARAHAVDFLQYNETSNQFTADCPACDTARPTKVLNGTFSGDYLICVVAGTFRDDPEKEPAGKASYIDSYNAQFENVPSPVEMAVGVFIIRCEACDALLDEDDRREDEEAPEVGWEYYECPECEAKTRADIAEHTYDTR